MALGIIAHKPQMSVGHHESTMTLKSMVRVQNKGTSGPTKVGQQKFNSKKNLALLYISHTGIFSFQKKQPCTVLNNDQPFVGIFK